MDLSISAITATSATADFSNTTAGHSVQVQYSTRPDFQLCVSPLITLTAEQPASLAMPGLNQDTGYYVRAREYLIADGMEGDWTALTAFRTPLDTAPDTSPANITHDPAMLVIPARVINWFADNEVSGFPVANLGFDAPVAWRSVGTPHGFTIEIAPEEIDTIALLMSNASEAMQVTISAGATKANAEGGSPSYSHGPVDFRASQNIAGRKGYNALIRLPAAQEYAFWHISIAGTLPGELFHMEHAVFGLNRATKKHAIDKTEAPLDLGTVSRGRSGVPLRALGYRMRKVDFEIAAMSEQQFETLYSRIADLVGLTEPVLVVPNPKATAFLHDRILYGTLVSSQATNIRGPLFSRKFSIESIV